MLCIPPSDTVSSSAIRCGQASKSAAFSPCPRRRLGPDEKAAAFPLPDRMSNFWPGWNLCVGLRVQGRWVFPCMSAHPTPNMVRICLWSWAYVAAVFSPAGKSEATVRYCAQMASGVRKGEAVLEPMQSLRISSTGLNFLPLFTPAFLGVMWARGQTPLDFAFLRLLCWFTYVPCRSYRLLVKCLLILMSV
jgi:hypothetical protein